MATHIISKKAFIESLEKQIKDDDVVVLSPDLQNASVKKKKNEKHVTFRFVADTFKQPDDVKHLFFNTTPAVAFLICSLQDLSDETVTLYKEEAKLG